MKFDITQTFSLDVLNKFKNLGKRIDVRVGKYLAGQFALRDYGEGLSAVVVGLNCINPELMVEKKDFSTGLVIDKKYIKSKKVLEFQVKLNHREISNADEDQIIDLIGEAILKSSTEIEILNIKNFKIKNFYSDLKMFIEDRSWLLNPELEKEFHFQHISKEENNKFSVTEKMAEVIFWELIEKSKVDSNGNLTNQIGLITDRLSKKEEKDIIGFECTLRELIIKSFHYNVMAVQKIIEGSVSDDSFLYFRCKLILYGRMTFENAINNPNYIFERIDPNLSGEPLLMIADLAFKMKFGDNNQKISPSEYGSKVIDYDYGEYEVQGKEWREEDLPKRYAKLFKAYAK